MLQSLDEWLQVSNDILGRMGELSVTSIDGSKSQEDRANAQLEFTQLSDELERISSDAKYNGINIAGAGQSKVEPLGSGSLLAESFTSTVFPSSNQDLSFGYSATGEDTVTLIDGINPPIALSEEEAQNFVTAAGDWSDTVSQNKFGTYEITYSYSNLFDGAMTGVTEEEMKSAIEESLELWASYSPLTFIEVEDAGPAVSDVAYAPGNFPMMRFGNHAIDGAGTVLGHAYYPLGTGLAGDVHYDNAEAWDASMFLETTVHEIGHAIGIAHSPLPTDALMNPIFASRYSGLGSAFLLQDDIDAVQSLYGERAGDTYTFQVGIEAGQTFEVAVANVDPQNLGIGDVDISTLSGAKDALVKISDATESVSKTRVTVGSGIKRFMSMLNSAIGLENNLAQVESRIRDVDIAKETTDLAMSQVLEGLGQKALVHHQEMVRAQASLVV